MRWTTLLPFVATASAFVLPTGEVDEKLASLKSGKSSYERHPHFEVEADDIHNNDGTLTSALLQSNNPLDRAISHQVGFPHPHHDRNAAFHCSESYTAFDMHSWLSSHAIGMSNLDVAVSPSPFLGSEHGGSVSKSKPKKSHHKRPHHHHGDHKPNMTLYQMIASSKFTTQLAKLIDEHEDLVSMLNGTAANYTVFAPTDVAFKKLPKDHKKPSKEILKKILSYHVSKDFYPAGRVLATHTIPTALEEESLGGAQRLRVGLGLRGLQVNFYSRIIAIDIFGTNGVLHGVDSLILPPPTGVKILSLLPSEFSTLDLALEKTGLGAAIAKAPHVGGTFFAPSNSAFRRLGPRINAFLFSDRGAKYLQALLKYHVVANETLYSDAFYKKDSASEESFASLSSSSSCADGGVVDEVTGVPKGVFHVDLPTLLGNKSLSVDVARYGGLVNMRINGYTDVGVQDGIARDGVLHVLGSVLIPPREPGMMVDGGAEAVGGDDEVMGVEEFKARLGKVVEEEDDDDEGDNEASWVWEAAEEKADSWVENMRQRLREAEEKVLQRLDL